MPEEVADSVRMRELLARRQEQLASGAGAEVTEALHGEAAAHHERAAEFQRTHDRESRAVMADRRAAKERQQARCEAPAEGSDTMTAAESDGTSPATA